MSEKQDVYSRVTNKIIADLERGNLTWLQPWQAGHAAGQISKPLRAIGKPYQGINVIMLWASAMEQGFDCPLWLTYKQAAGAPRVRYRRPADRRSRPQRWREAVAELVELQGEYRDWLDTLPPSLESSAIAEALRAICDLDLSELESVEPPRGFGRD
jgi:N-terminal domain of anti-restriction factor ArdC